MGVVLVQSYFCNNFNLIRFRFCFWSLLSTFNMKSLRCCFMLILRYPLRYYSPKELGLSLRISVKNNTSTFAGSELHFYIYIYIYLLLSNTSNEVLYNIFTNVILQYFFDYILRVKTYPFNGSLVLLQ